MKYRELGIQNEGQLFFKGTLKYPLKSFFVAKLNFNNILRFSISCILAGMLLTCLVSVLEYRYKVSVHNSILAMSAIPIVTGYFLFPVDYQIKDKFLKKFYAVFGKISLSVVALYPTLLLVDKIILNKKISFIFCTISLIALVYLSWVTIGILAFIIKLLKIISNILSTQSKLIKTIGLPLISI